jgi:imidazole glycerol-phosphate synthase subunit HisH
MRIALVDFGAGNLHSAHRALERAALESRRSVIVELVTTPDRLQQADRIVMPGDGAFRDAMQSLTAVNGMIAALSHAVLKKGKPFLGICVGMQLLASRGLEHGETQGLGWLPGTVAKIEPMQPGLKVPHMGWNTLFSHREHALTKGLKLGPAGLHAYFLHSYQVLLESDEDLLAEADYGGPITAIVSRENIAGTQFHPEKSQALGLRLLSNFLSWSP